MIRLSTCGRGQSERVWPHHQGRSATITDTTLPTRNSAWGFFDTIEHLEGDLARDAAEAWGIAFAAIARASGASPEWVRDFLDSHHGRHFADNLVNGLAKDGTLECAIDAAVIRWRG